MQPRVHFSNRLETLAAQLFESLVDQKRSIWQFPLIVVPSHEMRRWLTQKILEYSATKTCIGIRFLTLAQALCEFTNEPLTSPLPLSFQIFESIMQKINTFDALGEEEKRRFAPLSKYLQNEEHIAPLCRTLTHLFRRYQTYGRDQLKKWRSDPKHFQEELFCELFDTLPLIPSIKESAHAPSLAIFGFSHLSPLHFELFCQLGQRFPVEFFHLSPCQEFWSDFAHPREMRRLTPEHQKALSPFITDHHPLLQTLGKVGRKTALLFEESEMPSLEHYEQNEGTRRLSLLQEELLTLRRFASFPSDDSISCYLAHSRYREVEQLRDLILEELRKGTLEPRDCVILAPDISLYAPYIEALFHGEIPFQIRDLPRQTEDTLYKGLLALIDFAVNRFTAKDFLHLLRLPLFHAGQKWGKEEVHTIETWIVQSKICWGIDPLHQGSCLNKDPKDEKGSGSWSQGLDLLLEEFACGESISLTDASLLGELCSLFSSMSQDLLILSSQQKMKPPKWAARLLTLVETYFGIQDEPITDYLQRVSRSNLESPISFSTFFSLLTSQMQEETTHRNGQRLQTVTCASLMPMRALPTKWVALLGMNSEQFPRKERLEALNLLRGGDYCPSRIDYDRMLFLELLLSAREKLIFTALYGEEQILASPLSELLHLLQIEPEKLPAHPFTMKRLAKAPLPSIPKPQKSHQERLISIQALTQFMKSPLRAFTSSQGIHFWKKEEAKEEEAFFLSPLDRFHLMKQHLETGEMPSYSELPARPLGLFGDVASRELKAALDALPSIKEGTKTLHLVEGISSPFQHESGAWVYPALSLRGEWTVIGAIEGVTDEGLCVLEEGTLQGALRALPRYLSYLLLTLGSFPLIFAKGGKEKPPPGIDHEELLCSIIKAYSAARETPCWLYPELLKPLLDKKEDTFKKRWVDLLQKSYDPSLHWFVRSSSQPPSFETLLEQATTLYGELYESWL